MVRCDARCPLNDLELKRVEGFPSWQATKPAWIVHHKIIQTGGQQLTELMIEHGVGVSTVRTIAIKRANSDYFEQQARLAYLYPI